VVVPLISLHLAHAMTATSSAIANPIEWSARSHLQTVMARLRPREFAVQLWDGEQWPPEPPGPADFKLTFRAPNVVRNIFSDTSSLSFGEAYIYWRPWGSRFAD